MKHKAKVDPFLRIFIFVAVLVIIAAIFAVGLFYYLFGIPEPEGRSLASWPYTFTEDFSVWMKNENGNLTIEDIGMERLKEYGLWMQVLDETGKEIFSHNKPEGTPSSYSAAQMAAFSTSPYENGSTVFISSFEESGKTWSYLIGFPYAIGKHMLYYNGENVGRLSPVFRIGLGAVLGFLVIFFFSYGIWLSRHLAKMTKGIGSISLRAYSTLPEKGIFSQIYRALNKMDEEIRRSDQMKSDTERTRREWISNITHDLKTPLSPVKGYAELLSDGPMPDEKTIQEYGKLILKNANHAEKLIEDLKMTYQLQAGVIPYNPEEIPFVRYVKEVVIDVVNDPAFCNRRIEFESKTKELNICADVQLLRRALVNLMVNALTHNPPETNITVIADSAQGNALVLVWDNGIGMSREEQSRLFDRYYRGTNTKEKPEGSGLGLAIAKQIAVLHGGDISVNSKQGKGTEFTVSLPIKL